MMHFRTTPVKRSLREVGNQCLRHRTGNGDWLAAYAKDNGLVEDETSGLLILTMDTVSSCVPRAEVEYDNFTAGCPDFPTERIFKADYDGTMIKETQRRHPLSQHIRRSRNGW